MSEKQSNGVNAEVFRERRNKIREAVGGGVILWLGHMLQPRNYTDNTYSFRQNSHFLYYTGLAEPDLAVLSYPERDYDVLFSKPTTMDDIIWSGASQERMNFAVQAGIETIEEMGRLGVYLTRPRARGSRSTTFRPTRRPRSSGLPNCSYRAAISLSASRRLRRSAPALDDPKSRSTR